MSGARRAQQAAAFGAVNNPGSAAGAMASPDTYKMSSQPLSLGEAVVLIQNHSRPLRDSENRWLASPLGLDEEQIVMSLNLPASMLEHGLGIPTLSCVSDSTVHFHKAGAAADGSESQETTAEFRRNMFLTVLHIFTAIDAINAGLIQIHSDELGQHEAEERLRRLQHAFAVERKDWPEILEQSPANSSFMTLIETVLDSTRTNVESYRLVKIARGPGMLQRLQNSFQTLLDYMGRRYSEEKSHAHHIGHDSRVTPKAAPLPVVPDPGAQEEGQQRIDDFYGPAEAGGGGGGDDDGVGGGPNPAFNNAADPAGDPARKEFCRYGIDWADTPAYRRDKAESILSQWESSILEIVKLNWAHTGLPHSAITSLFNYVWAGDQFRFNLAGLDNGLRARSPYSRFQETGYLNKENARLDWKSTSGTHQAAMAAELSAIKDFQPAHLFPMHAMTPWITGQADLTQVHPGNYFRLQADQHARDYGIRGRPDGNIDTMLAEEIKRLRQVDQGKADYMSSAQLSHATIAAMLVGSGSPVAIGAKFKGFPYLERVRVLSPVSTTPWRIVLSPLPPPDELSIANAMQPTGHSSRETYENLVELYGPRGPQYMFNKIVRRLRYCIPNCMDVPAHLKRDASDFVWGNRQQVNNLSKNAAVVGALRPYLSELIQARFFIRFVATLTSGMLRDWKLVPQHDTVPEYGRSTLEMSHVGTLRDKDALFCGEPDSVGADHLRMEAWVELLKYCEEALRHRDTHLKLSWNSDLEYIEVSPFTRMVRPMDELLPWRTAKKLIAATNKMAQARMNGMIYDFLLSDTLSDSAGSEMSEHNTIWAHRRMDPNKVPLGPGPGIFRGTINGGTKPLIHRGWKAVGSLSNVQQKPHEELRTKTSFSDFVCTYHAQLNVYTENLITPLQTFIVAHEKDDAASLTGVLRDACVDALAELQEFFSLTAANTIRPLFTHVLSNFQSQNPDNRYRPTLPQAFSQGLSQWVKRFGSTGATDRIPFAGTTSRWKNLSEAHSVMCAQLAETFMRLGIGLANTSNMLAVAHLVHTSVTSSVVLRRKTAALGALHIVLSSDTSIGKSFLFKQVLELMVPETYETISGMSAQAMNVHANYDGMFVYMDEGMSSINAVRKENQDQGQIDTLKAAATVGYLNRLICNTDGERVQEAVVSSHRRSLAMTQNPGTESMDNALLSRFLPVILRSSFSSDQEPLKYSFAARAGQSAASDDQQDNSEIENVTFFWKQMHACKIIIEMLIYMRLIRVDIQIPVDYAHSLLETVKDKISYTGKMNRIHGLVPTLIRNQTSNLMAYMVLHDWSEQYKIHRRHRAMDYIPIDFILARATKYSYGTKSMVAYVISFLYRDLVDNIPQMDLVKSLMTLKNKDTGNGRDVNLDYKNSVYLTEIIHDRAGATASEMVSRRTGEADGGPEFENEGYARDAAPYVNWSDGSYVQRDRMTNRYTPHKLMLDLNYVVFDLKMPSHTKFVERLSAYMSNTKYGHSQLMSIIKEMTAQSFPANESNDFNRIAVTEYNALLQRHSLHLLELDRTTGRLGGRTAGGDVMQFGAHNSNNQTASPAVRAGLNDLQRRAQEYEDVAVESLPDGNMPPGSVVRTHEENHIIATDMKSAASRRMPLKYYRDGEPLPVAKWVVLGTGKRDTSYALAISRRCLEDVAKTAKHGPGSGDLPVISTLLSLMSTKMTSMNPFPFYPICVTDAILGESIPMPDSETYITTYVLDAGSSYVKGRVSAAVDAMRYQLPVQPCPEVAAMIEKLPEKLRREGASLSAHAPIRVTFSPRMAGRVSLTNISASCPVVPDLLPIEAMLTSDDAISFTAAGFFSDPANTDTESVAARRRRLIACTAERLRNTRKLLRDARALAYDVDWESYLQSCANRMCPADPLDPSNLISLPHCYLAHLADRGRRFLNLTEPTDMYPIMDTQHQLKQRVYSEFFDYFDTARVTVSKFHPSRFTHETFDAWLAKLVAAVDHRTRPLPSSPTMENLRMSPPRGGNQRAGPGRKRPAGGNDDLTEQQVTPVAGLGNVPFNDDDLFDN